MVVQVRSSRELPDGSKMTTLGMGLGGVATPSFCLSDCQPGGWIDGPEAIVKLLCVT